LPVEIAKRKGLNLEKKRVAQIAGHALPNLYGKDIVPDGEKGAQHRNAKHRQ
jgi:hypothetical protein